MADVAGTYFDREANGNRGAEITGPFVREVWFQMSGSVQCSERGVVELPDGRVYTLTVRRAGHADGSGYRRIATHMRYGTFQTTARGLLTFERDYINPLTYDTYTQDVHAL